MKYFGLMVLELESIHRTNTKWEIAVHSVKFPPIHLGQDLRKLPFRVMGELLFIPFDQSGNVQRINTKMTAKDGFVFGIRW